MGRLVEEQIKFAEDVAKLLLCVSEMCGYSVTLGEAYRTKEQQKLYIANGRSQTMNSMHLKRLAIDLNLFVDGNLTWDIEEYRILGEYWESLSEENVWGGSWKNFKDVPHFQRTFK